MRDRAIAVTVLAALLILPTLSYVPASYAQIDQNYVKIISINPPSQTRLAHDSEVDFDLKVEYNLDYDARIISILFLQKHTEWELVGGNNHGSYKRGNQQLDVTFTFKVPEEQGFSLAVQIVAVAQEGGEGYQTALALARLNYAKDPSPLNPGYPHDTRFYDMTDAGYAEYHYFFQSPNNSGSGTVWLKFILAEDDSLKIIFQFDNGKLDNGKPNYLIFDRNTHEIELIEEETPGFLPPSPIWEVIGLYVPFIDVDTLSVGKKIVLSKFLDYNRNRMFTVTYDVQDIVKLETGAGVMEAFRLGNGRLITDDDKLRSSANMFVMPILWYDKSTGLMVKQSRQSKDFYTIEMSLTKLISAEGKGITESQTDSSDSRILQTKIAKAYSDMFNSGKWGEKGLEKISGWKNYFSSNISEPLKILAELFDISEYSSARNAIKQSIEITDVTVLSQMAGVLVLIKYVDGQPGYEGLDNPAYVTSLLFEDLANTIENDGDTKQIIFGKSGDPHNQGLLKELDRFEMALDSQAKSGTWSPRVIDALRKSIESAKEFVEAEAVLANESSEYLADCKEPGIPEFVCPEGKVLVKKVRITTAQESPAETTEESGYQELPAGLPKLDWVKSGTFFKYSYQILAQQYGRSDYDLEGYQGNLRAEITEVKDQSFVLKMSGDTKKVGMKWEGGSPRKDTLKDYGSTPSFEQTITMNEPEFFMITPFQMNRLLNGETVTLMNNDVLQFRYSGTDDMIIGSKNYSTYRLESVHPESEGSFALVHPQTGLILFFVLDMKSSVVGLPAGNGFVKLEETNVNLSQESLQTGQNTGGGCLIATAAFGSELSPQVQFLREFRDQRILSTVAGQSFMNVFNAWYYSFSPYVADYERQNPIFQTSVKYAIYPLIGILSLSEQSYSLAGQNEYSTVIAGLTASSLIGAVYFWPIAMISKRIRNNLPNLRIITILCTASFIGIVFGIYVNDPNFLMITSSAFVLTLVGTFSIFSAFGISRLCGFFSKMRQLNNQTS